MCVGVSGRGSLMEVPYINSKMRHLMKAISEAGLASNKPYLQYLERAKMSEVGAVNADPDETEIFSVKLRDALYAFKICLMGTGLMAIRQISGDESSTLMSSSNPQHLVDIMVSIRQNTACAHLQDKNAA